MFTESDNLWRKRVIGCIAGYFRQQGFYQDLDYSGRLEKIKATAARSAGVSDFNIIPQRILRRIYNEFKNKQI